VAGAGAAVANPRQGGRSLLRLEFVDAGLEGAYPGLEAGVSLRDGFGVADDETLLFGEVNERGLDSVKALVARVQTLVGDIQSRNAISAPSLEGGSLAS
jgi:hypothetical protein